MEVKYDYESGFKGVRSIYKDMVKQGSVNDELFERLTFNLLNRTCPDWIKR